MTESVNGIWKSIALFLGGVVLSLTAMWATYVRGAISRADMEQYVNQRFSSIEQRLAELSRNMTELRELTARIDERTARGAGKQQKEQAQ